MIWVKKHHVFGELGQLFHQLKALMADRGQLFKLGGIVLLTRQAKIGQGDRIEVIVGQGNELEPDAAQGDDFVDDGLEFPLPGLLSVGAPDAAEGTMLGASANGLH